MAQSDTTMNRELGIIMNLRFAWGHGPITVAALSKAWTVFARSNAGIVRSNPTQAMDVCIARVYSVFVLFCV
jgi:hypothetical protein